MILAAGSDTGPVRYVAARLFEWAGSMTSRGELRVGHVAALPPGPLILRDVEIITPEGDVVLRSDEMLGHVEWASLLEGHVIFRRCRFTGTDIRLLYGHGGQVSLVYASEVPSSRPTIPLIWEDIELVDNSLSIDLPGKPPLRMIHVNGRAELRMGHRWMWTMHDVHGSIDLPLIDIPFSRMNARLVSDDPYPLIAFTEIDLGVATPDIGLDYFVPALAGLPGDPYLEFDLHEAHPMDELDTQ